MVILQEKLLGLCVALMLSMLWLMPAEARAVASLLVFAVAFGGTVWGVVVLARGRPNAAAAPVPPPAPAPVEEPLVVVA